jgi:putative FmdB family regulatory protein
VLKPVNYQETPLTPEIPLPLYDYKCRACSKVTEVRHGFREPYDGSCPDCGGDLARVFNPAGIVFKGSGFYLTDSRKAASDAKSSSASASSDKSSLSDTKSSPDAKSSSDAKSSDTKSSTTAPAASSSTSDSGPKKSESSAA